MNFLSYIIFKIMCKFIKSNNNNKKPNKYSKYPLVILEIYTSNPSVKTNFFTVFRIYYLLRHVSANLQ